MNNEYDCKTPLEYQITDYDCGTTTLLNAIRFLFYRSEISPEIYKFISHHTLDICNTNGEIGKGGTSTQALDFLSNWLNQNSIKQRMPILCTKLINNDVSIYNKFLEEKIYNGAVAILRVHQECEHYCLLTSLDSNFAYIFDPYYLEKGTYDDDNLVEMIFDKPFEYNRKIKKERLNSNSLEDFSLVTGKNGIIIIIEKIKIQKSHG